MEHHYTKRIENRAPWRSKEVLRNLFFEDFEKESNTELFGITSI